MANRTKYLAALLLVAALPVTKVASAQSAPAQTPVVSATVAADTISPAAATGTTAAAADPAAAAPGMAAELHQREQNLVNYIRHRFAVPEHKALAIVSEAYRSAVKQHTKPELILAVIAVESTFKERARNGGAMGLMQVIPRYHRASVAAVGGTRQLYSPVKNIQVGSGILAEYLRKSDGDLRQALMRYKGNFDRIGANYASKIMGVYGRLLQVNSDQLNVEE